MKKILFLTLVLTLGISAIANNRVLTDYVDNDKIFDILKNDTITLQYFGSENQFKFVEPDTIWKKRVKRPKENKHYYLQWYQPMDQTHGIPLNTQSGITKQFIFQNFVHHVDDGKVELFLFDLELHREIVFTPDKKINIIPCSIEDNILSLLKDSVIYYKPSKNNLSQEEDKLYEKTSIKNVHYNINIFPYAKSKPISLSCFLHFKNEINGYVNNNGIVFSSSEIEVITKEEFIKHNSYTQEILRQDSIVRLARIFDHTAVHNYETYGFEGDTMAIIQYYKDAKYSWSDSLDYFVAFAYGKDYTITIESYETIQDKIHFIDSVNLDFLKQRNERGLATRTEMAKKWDNKNNHIIQNDFISDTSKVIMGTYIDDWTIQKINIHGVKSSEYETPPSSGTQIPIFKYDSGGDILCSWWGSYNGNIFAIDWRGIKFENDSDRLYLMRRGSENLKERYTKAFARDIADRLIEQLELEAQKEEKKQKKIQEITRRKIFILGIAEAYGDYDWCGIKPTFFNCYSKTIKYIDCLVVPFNRFEDEESDDYGRKSKEIRCVGPFEPGEVASWRFDSMFKDENGMIRFFRITNLKITFMDNSTISYKGWENVEKHCEYVPELF